MQSESVVDGKGSEKDGAKSVHSPSVSVPPEALNGGPSIEQILRGQLEDWRRRLLDISKTNALIKCSFDKTRGVVEILHPPCETIWRQLAADAEAGSVAMRFPWHTDLVPPTAEWKAEAAKAKEAATAEADGKAKTKEKEWNPPLAECLASSRLREGDLVAEFSDKALDRRLRTLNGYAELSLSEQGVHCLYVVFGFLKWFESTDSEEPLFSPLMLVPVSLTRRTADAPWEILEAEDDAIDNRCLRESLRHQFKLSIPPLPDIDQLEAEQARLDYLESVRKAIAGNDRWQVVDRCVLGRFAFPKVAMWQDLGEHSAAVLAHPLCRSIGGDVADRPASVFGCAEVLPNSRELDDELVPGEVKAILDCDSSQLEAVVAARRGVSFVLDGPPGTGKSQTIANIIADALAEGRRVLFVSEKVSALEVVKRRLDDNGLGEFCLECHSSKANRKAILEELKYCLELPTEVYKDARPKLREAHERRNRLNEYVRSIHAEREPLGISPFELFGRVSHLNRLGISSKTRCVLPSVPSIKPGTLNRWLDLLQQATEVRGVLKRHAEHPWRGCKVAARTLSLSDDLRHHVDVIVRSMRLIDEVTRPLATAGFLPFSVTPSRMAELSKLLREAAKAPVVPESWFADPKRVASAVLERVEADGIILDQGSRLSPYSEEGLSRFPFDAVNHLGQSPSRTEIQGVITPLSETVRAQGSELKEIQSKIASFHTAADDLDGSLSKLVRHLALPLRGALPVSSIPKFLKLARSITENLPMRPGWFDSTRWSALRQQIAEMPAKVVRRRQIETAASGTTPAELDVTGRLACDPEELGRRWEEIRTFCAPETPESLNQLADLLDRTTAAFREVQQSSKSVLQGLGIDPSLSLDVAEIHVLLAAGKSIATASALHGAWKDRAIRSQVAAACETCLSDLGENQELRRHLEERLSHRAFRPAAMELANQSTKFESLFSRLFGGFKKFQRDVAELYKSGVPSSSQLLQDLTQLRKFHRRREDCSEVAAELSAYLPGSDVADQESSWSTIRQGLSVIEQLESSAPGLLAALPSTSLTCDPNAVTKLLSDLEGRLACLERLHRGTVLEGIVSQPAKLASVLEQLERLTTAAKQCSGAYSANSSSPRNPSSFTGWLNDVRQAKEYVALSDELKEVSERLSDLMPDASPFSEAAWQRFNLGIDIAERISPLVRSLDSVRDVYCKGEGIDADAVRDAIEQTQVANTKFNSALQQIQSAVDLNAGNSRTDDPLRQPVEVLREKAVRIRDRIEARISQLSVFEHVVRPEADIALDRIPTDADAIRALLSARNSRESANQTLIACKADDPDRLEASGVEAAEWLDQVVVTPLLKAVATDTQTRRWVETASETIRKVADPEFSTAWQFLQSLFDLRANISTGFVPAETAVGELADRLERLPSQISELDEWLKFSRWQLAVSAEGLGEVVDELVRGRYEPEEVAEVVTARFYRHVFDHLAENDPLLREFDLEAHGRVRDRFRELDEWEVKAAATQIRQYQLGRGDRPRPGWNIPVTSELGILQKEIQKKRRNMPLRKLFAEIPGVLQRLKPCIMMSPLSVSTFLQTDKLRFDLVIFDEASQVFPWDAIGAIYRGSQLIVAGDEQQLPPTDFFSRSESDEAEEDAGDSIGDFGSILSLCKSINMPGKRLRWHYRSRREPLITFSNRHFYDGDLVTFPSIRDASHDAVALDYVPSGKWLDRKNLPEAERIADLIIEHHRKSRHASLGVIAFNVTQQRAIEDILFERRKKDPEIDVLLSGGLTEPLFIKNLENVQGDERDVILLSMGYARNEAGTFSKNFGPLSKKGGQRRLNVAVTRAREQLTLVASVRAVDMDIAPSMSQGAHLLKAYLEYAERGVDAMAERAVVTASEADSPFEADVAAALIERGLEPVPQVGCGGFRIDLALKHPRWPGRFCLGVECDGATYHSSHTARDRDRIRQSVLEQLGWKIIRVWSTDWVRNPERQIQRILEAYAAASVVEEVPLPEMPTRAEQETAGDADLEPQIVQQAAEKPRQAFGDIEQVSAQHIGVVIREILTRAGATSEDDLVRLVARELGFGRTGRKIRIKVETILQAEIRRGSIQRAGDRIAIAVK